MKEEIAIEVNDVSMRFNMSKEKVDNLKEYIIKLFNRQLFFQEFWALRNISISIKKGEIFGIIGLNGAGKSTLLKILAGVLKPTGGSVSINGSVAPLIELGAGFDPSLTGKENIFLNGAILGHSRKYMEKKFDDIVEFADLENFLDMPLKNYSSGMKARLGFSIATTIRPQILIVDEILAVGDHKFQQKCEWRIKEMLSEEVSVVLVSHSINQVENLCDRVLWLEKGKAKMIGETQEVCRIYKNS